MPTAAAFLAGAVLLAIPQILSAPPQPRRPRAETGGGGGTGGPSPGSGNSWEGLGQTALATVPVGSRGRGTGCWFSAHRLFRAAQGAQLVARHR